jgi:hypothetical protein
VGESKLSPLQHNVQIVNSDGTPTPYFIQLLQQLYEEKNDISDQVELTAGLDLIAGAGLTGGGPLDGSAGDITLSASVQAILDLITTTRGAILYKGAAVWSALLPGAAGNVLQTNGAGADPTWVAPAAGGGALVFIQRITVAVAGGAISFTPISGAYKDLVLSARLRGNEASAVINSYIRFNNDAAANYDYMGMQATAAVLQNFSGVATATPFSGAVPSGGATAGFFSSHEIRVPLYASATMEKVWSALGYAKGTNVATNMFNQNVSGSWRSTAAITRVDLVPSLGVGWAAGSIADLYGRS